MKWFPRVAECAHIPRGASYACQRVYWGGEFRCWYVALYWRRRRGGLHILRLWPRVEYAYHWADPV